MQLATITKIPKLIETLSEKIFSERISEKSSSSN